MLSNLRTATKTIGGRSYPSLPLALPTALSSSASSSSSRCFYYSSSAAAASSSFCFYVTPAVSSFSPPSAARRPHPPAALPTGFCLSRRGFSAYKRGSAVESYRKVDIHCRKCGELLARYHKRNGTKTNLIKMYVERVAEDPHAIFRLEGEDVKVGIVSVGLERSCPNCGTAIARGPQLVRGQPAWKMISGRVSMS